MPLEKCDLLANSSSTCLWIVNSCCKVVTLAYSSSFLNTIFSVCFVWYYSSLVSWWFCNIVSLVVVSSYYFFNERRSFCIYWIFLDISTLSNWYPRGFYRWLALFSAICRRFIGFDEPITCHELQSVHVFPFSVDLFQPCTICNPRACFPIWIFQTWNSCLLIQALLNVLVFPRLCYIIDT